MSRSTAQRCIGQRHLQMVEAELLVIALNILLMVAVYTLMLWLDIPINVIIWIFGLLVSALMLVMMRWNKLNQQRDPNLLDQIGQEGHGKAL
jgi:hypothetical protein